MHNIFPISLLPLATNVSPAMFNFKTLNSSDEEHHGMVGDISFIAPIHPEGCREITLRGFFFEYDEVIISAKSIHGFNFNGGSRSISLKPFPNLSLSMDEEFSSVFRTAPLRKCNILRVVKNIGLTDGEVIDSVDEEISVKIDGILRKMNAEEFINKIHWMSGHPRPSTMVKTLMCMNIHVNPTIINEIYDKCTECTRLYHSKGRTVHADTDFRWRRGSTGFVDITEVPVKGIGGARYLLTLRDQLSGFCSITPLNRKYEGLPIIANFLDYNPQITTLRSDTGGEFISADFLKMVSERGVGRNKVAVGASESNGAAERLNRLAKEKIDKLMELIHFEDVRNMWPWFAKAAENVINCTFSESREGVPTLLRERFLTTDHQKLKGAHFPPSFGFGDVVYFSATRDFVKHDKTATGDREGIFLSYLHSGSCEVMSVDRGKAKKWSIHPKDIKKGNDERRDDLLKQILECLKNKKVNTSSKCPKDTKEDDDSSSDEEIEEEEDKFAFTRNARKQRAKVTPKINGRAILRARNTPENISTPNKIIYNHHRASSSLFSFLFSHEGSNYVTISPPSHGLVKADLIVNNHLSNNIKSFRISDCWKNKSRACISPDGRVTIINSPPKGVGKFHPDVGYIGPDEAPYDDVKEGLFEAADIKEFLSIHENATFVKESPSPDDTVIRTRFRRVWKPLPGQTRKAKSRLLVCANNDPRCVDTATELPQGWIRRSGITFGLSQGWTAATIDVQTAFLLVTLPEDHGKIFVRLPKHLPKEIIDLGYVPGEVYRLQKSLYGLKEAPRLFNEYLAEKVLKLGWKAVAPGIFMREGGIMMAYVDDIMVMSNNPTKDLEEVSREIKCSDLLPVGSEPQRHVGYEIYSTEGRIMMDINPYLQSLKQFPPLIDDLGGEYAYKRLSPNNLPLSEFFDENPTFPPEHIHLMQRIVGGLCWGSTCHPGVSARHGEMASLTHKPSATAFRICKGIIHELTEEGVTPLEFQEINSPEIRLWVDCAVRDHDGRRGWVIQVADASWTLTNRTNVVHWKSAKDRMKHASSTSGEVNALLQALEETVEPLSFLSTLFPDSKLRILSDSMSGILQIKNGGSTHQSKARALYIRYLIAHTPIPNCGIEHVSGDLQMADPLTKIKILNWFSAADDILTTTSKKNKKNYKNNTEFVI